MRDSNRTPPLLWRVTTAPARGVRDCPLRKAPSDCVSRFADEAGSKGCPAPGELPDRGSVTQSLVLAGPFRLLAPRAVGATVCSGRCDLQTCPRPGVTFQNAEGVTKSIRRRNPSAAQRAVARWTLRPNPATAYAWWFRSGRAPGFLR